LDFAIGLVKFIKKRRTKVLLKELFGFGVKGKGGLDTLRVGGETKVPRRNPVQAEISTV
jgi:hypothetical protein